MSVKNKIENEQPNFIYVPPEGQYGYVVALGLVILFVTAFVPIACLGLIYGPYLREIGDETSSVTTTSSLYNTVYHLAGFIVNPLFQKLSKRTIGLIGATLMFASNIGCIFITSLQGLVISLSLLQGVGAGFLIPAIITSFTDYFVERKSFVMGICQSTITAITVVYPMFIKYLMESYGFRGTVAIIAALCTHNIFAAIALHPVEWHMKKKPITDSDIVVDVQNDKNVEMSMKDNKEAQESDQLLKSKDSSIIDHHLRKKVQSPRPSIISIGSFIAPSVVSKKTNEGFWKSLIGLLDLSVLKDPFYLNLSIGLSVSLLSELNFIPILPGYLTTRGYTKQDIAVIMTVYFASDLVGRLFYTILASFVTVSNKFLFLCSTFLCIIVRLVFTFNSDYWGFIITCSCLGALRAFIHTPAALALAEEYPESFSSAFTLYMVLCGLVALIVGQTMNLGKYLTGSDKIVMHIMTVQFAIVVVAWTLEMVYKRAKGIKPNTTPKKINVAH